MLIENRIISVTDCDYQGRVRPDYFLVMFGEVANRDAESVRLYTPEMVGRYGWVVVKQTLKLHAPLYDRDHIVVTTSPAKSSPAVFSRYYKVEKDDELIGECFSYWTLIDLEKRSIARAKDAGIDYTSETFKMPGRPKTLKPLADYDHHTTYTVKYSDTDINQHFNNTRYARLATDLIDYNYFKNHTLKEMSINYRKEIPAQCTFDVYMKQDQNTFYFEGKRDDVSCFLMELIYEEIA